MCVPLYCFLNIKGLWGLHMNVKFLILMLKKSPHVEHKLIGANLVNLKLEIHSK